MNYTGKSGSIKAVTTGGTAAAVGEVKNFSITTAAEIIEDTALGDDWKSNKPGLKSFEGSVECHYDPADAAQADLVEGEEVDLELYPSGETSTREKLAGTAIVNSVEVGGVDNASIVSFSVSFTGSGALTRSTVS